MRHLRCSISKLLGAVLFVAVGFVALREAGALWDRWIFSAVVGLLMLSILPAAHCTGAKRESWIGFTLFGWGYLGLSMIPAVETRLVSRDALEFVHRSKIFYTRAYRVRAVLALNRMRDHNLTPADLKEALTPSGLAPSGSGPDDDLMKVVEEATGSPAERSRSPRVIEPILSWGSRSNRPEQYEDIILKATPDGEILRVKDVARLEIGPSFYAPRPVGTRGFRPRRTLALRLAGRLAGRLALPLAQGRTDDGGPALGGLVLDLTGSTNSPRSGRDAVSKPWLADDFRKSSNQPPGSLHFSLETPGGRPERPRESGLGPGTLSDREPSP